MKCPNCGSEQNSNFCTACGARLINRTDETVSEANTSIQSDPPKTPNKKNPYSIWAFVLSIITLLFCAAPVSVVLFFAAGAATLIFFSFKNVSAFGTKKGLTIAAIVITAVGILFGLAIPKDLSDYDAAIPAQEQLSIDKDVNLAVSQESPTNSLPATNTPSPTLTLTPTPLLTPSPSPTLSPKPTPTITIAVSSYEDNSQSSVDNQSIVDLLNLTLQDGDGYSYDVSYISDGNFFLVRMNVEGATVTGITAQSGNQTSIALWNDFVDSVCSLSDSIKETIDLLGSDAYVSIMVLNEYNTDNVILSTLDSVVISNILYD